MATRVTDSIRIQNCLKGDAYVKQYRPWVLLSLALVTVSISSGLIYGWPALRLQLQNVDGSILSEEQFGLMFTVGSWSTQGITLFVGMARDRFGTKLVTCFAMTACILGLIGVGLCGPDQIVALTISLFLIGFSAGANLCLLPIAELFPNDSAIVQSCMSGAFCVSVMMFSILTTFGNSRRNSILVLAAVIAVLTILLAVFLPAANSFLITEGQAEVSGNKVEEKWETSKDDEESEEEIVVKEDGRSNADESTVDPESLANDFESGDETEKRERDDSPHDVTTEDNLSSPPTALQQMKTPEYLLLCTWFSIAFIPMQYYVGTIGFQLETLGDDTGLYTDIFAYCFAGAAISAPLAGWIADRFGLAIGQCLSTLFIAISIFMMAAKDSISLNAHIVGFAVYGIGRMEIFGMFFLNCGTRFGYANYGTLAGVGLFVSAMASCLQYPLIAWTAKGDSGAVNIFMGVVLLLQAPYYVWLNRREKLSDSAMCPSGGGRE